MKTYDTLSQAIAGFKQQGYTKDFNLLADKLECRDNGHCFEPTEFHVDAIRRYEGMSNTDDNSVLYAISTSSGLKGLLVDAFGVYSDSLSPAMIEKLRIDNKTRWA